MRGGLANVILWAELEERLLEMLRNKNHNVGDPAGKCKLLNAGLWGGEGGAELRSGAELHAAIRSSLRRKVESLEEDNWMFEAESGKGE